MPAYTREETSKYTELLAEWPGRDVLTGDGGQVVDHLAVRQHDPEPKRPL